MHVGSCVHTYDTTIRYYFPFKLAEDDDDDGLQRLLFSEDVEQHSTSLSSPSSLLLIILSSFTFAVDIRISIEKVMCEMSVMTMETTKRSKHPSSCNG